MSGPYQRDQTVAMGVFRTCLWENSIKGYSIAKRHGKLKEKPTKTVDLISIYDQKWIWYLLTLAPRFCLPNYFLKPTAAEVGAREWAWHSSATCLRHLEEC